MLIFLEERCMIIKREHISIDKVVVISIGYLNSIQL